MVLAVTDANSPAIELVARLDPGLGIVSTCETAATLLVFIGLTDLTVAVLIEIVIVNMVVSLVVIVVRCRPLFC